MCLYGHLVVIETIVQSFGSATRLLSCKSKSQYYTQIVKDFLTITTCMEANP